MGVCKIRVGVGGRREQRHETCQYKENTFSFSCKKYVENMKGYVKNVENIKEYVENIKKYVENIKKYEGISPLYIGSEI